MFESLFKKLGSLSDDPVRSTIHQGRIKLESNASSISTRGTRVTFDGKSWYDTATGEFRIMGEIYIKVNGRKLDEGTSAKEVIPDKPVTESREYTANSLRISASRATVTVTAEERRGIRVVMTGYKSDFDTIKTEIAGDELHVCEDESFASSFSVSSASVFARGSSISFEDSVSALKIDIFVPIAARIDTRLNGTGKIVVGDTNGCVSAVAMSIGDIRLGNIGGTAILETLGTGKVTTGNIGGNLLAYVTSIGKIAIGNIHGKATLETSGNGDITVGYAQDSVVARASSIGKIAIEGVRGDALLETSGNGNITVGSGEIDYLDAQASSIGAVKVRATAKTAKLRASGIGNITVDRVIQPPDKKSSSIGKISVKQIG